VADLLLHLRQHTAKLMCQRQQLIGRQVAFYFRSENRLVDRFCFLEERQASLCSTDFRLAHKAKIGRIRHFAQTRQASQRFWKCSTQCSGQCVPFPRKTGPAVEHKATIHLDFDESFVNPRPWAGRKDQLQRIKRYK